MTGANLELLAAQERARSVRELLSVDIALRERQRAEHGRMRTQQGEFRGLPALPSVAKLLAPKVGSTGI